MSKKVISKINKDEEVQVADADSFSLPKWKEIFEAYCQTNKISNIVFLPANQSYALAVQKNYGNKPIDQLTDMYKSVHESVFGLLTTAVVEKTGSSIIVELKDSQQ